MIYDPDLNDLIRLSTPSVFLRAGTGCGGGACPVAGGGDGAALAAAELGGSCVDCPPVYAAFIIELISSAGSDCCTCLAKFETLDWSMDESA